MKQEQEIRGQSSPAGTLVERGDREVPMTRVERILGVATVILGVTLAAAASGAGPADREARVDVRLFQFKPSPTEVKVGTRVTWTTHDQIEHTVTSGIPEQRDGRFDARLSGKGATATLTFTEAGTYRYFCSRHNSMQAEVRVR
jgi:plastocyanin